MPFPEFQRAVLALTGDLELTSWWLFSVTNRKEGARFPSRELLQGETPGMKRRSLLWQTRPPFLCAMVVCVFQFLDKLSKNQSPLKAVISHAEGRLDSSFSP